MQTQVAVARNWETWLKNSIGPASNTEQADAERTEKRIREAIQADSRLAGKVRVFVKGSYAQVLTKPGTYQLVCTIHTAEGMKMTIVVK